MEKPWSYYVLRNMHPLNAVLVTGKDGSDKLALVVSKDEDGRVTVVENNDEYGIVDNKCFIEVKSWK